MSMVSCYLSQDQPVDGFYLEQTVISERVPQHDNSVNVP